MLGLLDGKIRPRNDLTIFVTGQKNRVPFVLVTRQRTFIDLGIVVATIGIQRNLKDTGFTLLDFSVGQKGRDPSAITDRPYQKHDVVIVNVRATFAIVIHRCLGCEEWVVGISCVVGYGQPSFFMTGCPKKFDITVVMVVALVRRSDH